MIANELIEIFLKNFNYLNVKGRRGGFFKCLYNGALTSDLEGVAKNLREELSALEQEEKKGDIAKCCDAISLIKDAFTKCKHVREDRAEWHHYHYEASMGRHRNSPTGGIEYDYKYPYKPSKFENELIRGLEFSISFLDEQLTAETLKIKKELCTLLYDVSHFSHPHEIIKNERTWLP